MATVSPPSAAPTVAGAARRLRAGQLRKEAR